MSQNFVKFQKFQLENLVDFEKCCQTHIFLQKSVLIQPKTSNILPKFFYPQPSEPSPHEVDNPGSVVALLGVDHRRPEQCAINQCCFGPGAPQTVNITRFLNAI